MRESLAAYSSAMRSVASVLQLIQDGVVPFVRLLAKTLSMHSRKKLAAL